MGWIYWLDLDDRLLGNANSDLGELHRESVGCALDADPTQFSSDAGTAAKQQFASSNTSLIALAHLLCNRRIRASYGRWAGILVIDDWRDKQSHDQASGPDFDRVRSLQGCRNMQEADSMHHIASLFVRCRVRQGGQTMTEYALILAAVALVACAAYQLMGTTITTTLSSVDNLL